MAAEQTGFKNANSTLLAATARPSRAAEAQWQQTVAALRFPEMLRRLSWQHLAVRLAIHDPLQWLVDGLRGKYGVIGQL
jgi:hypothetical protein